MYFSQLQHQTVKKYSCRTVSVTCQKVRFDFIEVHFLLVCGLRHSNITKMPPQKKILSLCHIAADVVAKTLHDCLIRYVHQMYFFPLFKFSSRLPYSAVDRCTWQLASCFTKKKKITKQMVYIYFLDNKIVDFFQVGFSLEATSFYFRWKLATYFSSSFKIHNFGKKQQKGCDRSSILNLATISNTYQHRKT